MKTVQGDLIGLAKRGEFDLIIHGCNCMCRMGAGIAKIIKTEFPQAYAADCATAEGDERKMGSITHAEIMIDIITPNNDDNQISCHYLIIVNGYTQFNFRGKGILANYDAIRSVMRQVKQKFPNKRIGYPKIGCGLAKGDWSIVSKIIDEELEGEDHTYVEFP